MYIYEDISPSKEIIMLLRFSLLLFISISSAQKEYKPFEYKPDFQSPYSYDANANFVQKEIEEWITREKTNASKKDTFVVLRTDVLGRSLSSRTAENLKKSRKVSKIEQKRLVAVSDMHISDEPIEEVHGRYEYDAKTNTKKYYINGQELSEQNYFSQIEKMWERHNKRKKGKRNLLVPGEIKSDDRRWVAWMTAEEISELLRNKELAISDYIEPQDNVPRSTVLALTQLSSHAFSNGYYGNGIGVYFTETGCPNLTGTGINTYNYVQGSTCFNGVKSHPTGVTRVLQTASPNAKIYGFDQVNWPSNPFTYSPPLEIGSHSWSVGGKNYYTQTDADMDNYIYENRVIEFVAAGNNTTYVTSPGKAVNAITVGSVEPETGSYACYSNWKNSEISNEKPEVAAYTDIDFSDNSVMVNYFPASYYYSCPNYHPAGNFGGTSAATPLLAGFTATLLQQHPFFKRHPALVKALYLTGSTVPINGNHDTDNVRSAKSLIPYSSVAWNTRSWYCEGGNTACFNSNNVITITENNIPANKRYRIAIAWLVPSNYTMQHKDLSQDLDLEVYQNGQYIGGSLSWYNPFEVVDFVTKSNAPLKITIRRYRNGNNVSGGGNVLLGYNLWENN